MPQLVFYTLVVYTLPTVMLDTYRRAGPATQFQNLATLLKQTPGTVTAMAKIKIRFEFLRTGVQLDIKQMTITNVTNFDGSITYTAGILIPIDSPILIIPEYDQRGL